MKALRVGKKLTVIKITGQETVGSLPVKSKQSFTSQKPLMGKSFMSATNVGKRSVASTRLTSTRESTLEKGLGNAVIVGNSLAKPPT